MGREKQGHSSGLLFRSPRAFEGGAERESEA